MYVLYKLASEDAPDAPASYWAIGNGDIATFVVEPGSQITEHLESGWSRVQWHRNQVEDIMASSALGMTAERVGEYETLAECRSKMLGKEGTDA